MRPKLAQLPAAGDVPEPNHPVFAAGHQRLEIRREGDRPDAVRLRLKRGRFAAGDEIPEDDLPLLGTRRGQGLAVGAKRQAENAVDMAPEGAVLLARGGVPDLDGLVRAGRDELSGHNEPCAVRTERDAAGTFAAVVRIVSPHRLTAGRIPEHYPLIAPR